MNRYEHLHENALGCFEKAGVKVMSTDELCVVEMYLKRK